jgi:glycosyltransferase involved in cell wall biosynthesis
MKICHVVPSLQEQHGGPSKSVRALCRALAQTGHSVELLTTATEVPAEGTDEMESGVRIRTFRRDWPQRLYFSSGLQQALAKTDAELIHHHALWLRTLHYAHRTAAKKGIPLVTSPRGMMSPWAWRHHGWRKAASRTLIHPGALTSTTGWHVTAPSEESDVRALGFTQPICVAPNGVDAPTEAEVARGKEYWHATCPATINRPTALFYGRFHQKKRVLELIDSWLEHAPAEWLLLLVGIAEDYTPEHLERYVSNRSAAGRVRAFHGTGMPPPYAVASLFLLPSHSENFGLTIAEAMANAVPVVVTDSTPWSEVNGRQCGWCVPWTEYGATISAVTARSRAELETMGAKARRWVLQEYSWDHSARVLTQFYHQLIGGPST